MSGASGATSILAAQSFGAGMSTAGSYYTAKGEKLALRGQADLAENNAKLSELQAQSAIRQGKKVEQSLMLNTAKMKSSQRASMAANGIDISNLNAGDTAVNILSSTEYMGETDVNTAAANTARSAWGYRTEGVNFTNDALLKRGTAKGINPMSRAATTLLSSATDVGKSYYQFKQAGAWDVPGGK